jgi:GDP-4-dehydro-6-deoxy-D-mannose reductase
VRRVLITGATGFVGRYLASFCAEQGAEVVGLSRRRASEDEPPEALARYHEVDMADAGATREVIASERPERIFHLAGEASVADSWRRPQPVIEANLTGASNLLEAVRSDAPEARVLLACSGTEYGAVPPEELPMTEDRPLRPQDPYAVGKACIDLLGGFFADGHGLHVVRTRAFNHTGPGQSDTYAVPSFARQIAEAWLAGRQSIELQTGNLEVRRDFTDVRDVVRGYWLALAHADPGAFNICSGRSVELSEVVRRLAESAGIEAVTRVDPDRLRAAEVVDAYGSPERLAAATGWRPELPLERTLDDVLEWWRAELSVANG